MTVLLGVRKFNARPSSFLGIEDSYTAWCFDEAVLYMLSEIENTGEIPGSWLAGGSKSAVESMLQRKGVIFNDRRRNNKRQSGA